MEDACQIFNFNFLKSIVIKSLEMAIQGSHLSSMAPAYPWLPASLYPQASSAYWFALIVSVCLWLAVAASGLALALAPLHHDLLASAPTADHTAFLSSYSRERIWLVQPMNWPAPAAGVRWPRGTTDHDGPSAVGVSELPALRTWAGKPIPNRVTVHMYFLLVLLLLLFILKFSIHLNLF